MSKMTLAIEVLTPVHIGTGTVWKGNYEYLIFPEEGVVAQIDEFKVLQIIGEENLSHWISIIDKGEDLLAYLRRRKPDLQAADVARHIVPVNDTTPNTNQDIKTYIRGGSQDQPLIPGSSIKGSIRTALFTKMVKDNPKRVDRADMLGSTHRRTGKYKFNDSQLNATFFSDARKRRENDTLRNDPNKDWLRFLRLGDVAAVNTEVYKAQILNQTWDDWEVKESNYMECLSPNQPAISGTLQIANKQLQNALNINLTNPIAERYLNDTTLFQIINQHTAFLIAEELKFVKSQDSPIVFGEFESEMNRLKGIIANCSEKECVLRLGGGSGWEFITGAWARQEGILSDDNWYELKRRLRWKRYDDGVAFPKTRKVIEGGVPMGFLKLHLE